MGYGMMVKNDYNAIKCLIYLYRSQESFRINFGGSPCAEEIGY